MLSVVRDLYQYAKKNYPEVAEHLAWLDQEIADHQTQILEIVRTRLEVLRLLHEGKGLEAIINPKGGKRSTADLLLERSFWQVMATRDQDSR